MSAFSSSIYVALTAAVSRALLSSENVRSIYVRRSVAAKEAVFPLSDVDLAMVVAPATGLVLARLARRYRLARALVPRLGECLVFTPADLREFACTDPYRASIDRRVHITIRGERPAIPVRPIPPVEAARRLVFWFDEYIPRALRQGNERNLKKFALEMANALGLIENRWSEPLASRTETLRRWGRITGDPFQFCCEAAAAAHAWILPPAPRLRKSLQLPGLIVLPGPGPAFRPPVNTRVLTPEALDLLIQTQNPCLWWRYGEDLAEAGFRPPSPSAWRAYALRCVAPHRLRGPGLAEAGAAGVLLRIQAAARILEELPPPLPACLPRPAEYYEEIYDSLAAWAAGKRQQILAATEHSQA